MIKTREAYQCNLKLILIWLTVAGHCLETGGLEETRIYRGIYLFHMPLFAFLSGLHLNRPESCKRQCLAALKLYLPSQLAVTAVKYLFGLTPCFLSELAIPFWHLWYLLSLCLWSLLLLCCHRLVHLPSFKLLLPGVSLLIALTCGTLPFGRWMSLSRTFCFFSYVLMGAFLPERLRRPPSLRQRLFMILAGLNLGLIPICWLLQNGPTAFLYRADSFSALGLSREQGLLLRLLCLCAAISLGLILFSLTPDRVFPCTKIGGDTMQIYLLHVCFLPVLSLMPPANLPAYFLCAFVIVCLLWAGFRWVRGCYRITGRQSGLTAPDRPRPGRTPASGRRRYNPFSDCPENAPETW